MQALQEKQAEAQKYKEMFQVGNPEYTGQTIQERILHLKDIEYNKNTGLFVVQNSTIHKAAFDGSIEGVKSFLDGKTKGSKRKVRINDYDNNFVCAIHYAAQQGWPECVEFLISRGSDVDLVTGDLQTPLMYASRGNHLEVVELLLNVGAKIWAVNRSGLCAVHFAAQCDHKDTIEMMMKMFEELKLTLLGADQAARDAADGKGTGGPTEEKKEKKIETKQEKAERKAKEKAAKSGEDGEVKKKADGSLKGGHIFTLEEVIFIEELDVLQLASTNGTTPLHCACSVDSINVIQYLIDKKVNVNLVDSTGESAMHKAARRNCFQAYKLLKAAGGDEYLKNKIRETPRQLLYDDTKY